MTVYMSPPMYLKLRRVPYLWCWIRFSPSIFLMDQMGTDKECVERLDSCVSFCGRVYRADTAKMCG